MTKEERKQYCLQKAKDRYARMTAEQKDARRHRARELRNSSIENWLKTAVRAARQRCKKSGIPFSLHWSDVEITDVCPITLLPFRLGQRNRQSPSIDRVVPELGYVSGNVRLISWYANAIKRDCSDGDIFIRLSEYLRKRPGAA